jgi:hypothetical protein
VFLKASRNLDAFEEVFVSYGEQRSSSNSIQGSSWTGRALGGQVSRATADTLDCMCICKHCCAKLVDTIAACI